MKKLRKPVKQIVIGTYESMKAASKQVDLLMRGNSDLCVNIVQDGRRFVGGTVVGKKKSRFLAKAAFSEMDNLA